MALMMFSQNGSACTVCNPFEGEIFTDADDPGHESCDSVEAAGAFHSGCHHSWEPVDADLALLKQEDELVSRGTEWEGHDMDTIQRRPDFEQRWDMLRKTNGSISATERTTLKTYTNNGYQKINGQLRNNPRFMYGNSVAPQVKKMDAVMARSSLKHDMTLVRGTNSTSLDEDLLMKHLGQSKGLTDAQLKNLVGKTFKDDGYFSTSAFRHGAFSGRKYDIEVIAPKGTRGVWVGPKGKTYYGGWNSGVSAHTLEMEFILDRGSEFRILSIRSAGGERIKMKVIIRQTAQDPAVRLQANLSAQRAANAAAKKLPIWAPPKPPTLNVPSISGPIPSPTSVAKGLEKMNIGQVPGVEVQAAWVQPGQMAIKLVDKSTGQVLKNQVVSVTKLEAQAAKTAGNAVQAVKYQQAPAVAAAAPAPTTAASTATAIMTGKVPAVHVKQMLLDLGMTKGQLAKAVGKSPSLITEWTGGGHGNLLNMSQWAQVKAQAVAWANPVKPY